MALKAGVAVAKRKSQSLAGERNSRAGAAPSCQARCKRVQPWSSRIAAA